MDPARSSGAGSGNSGTYTPEMTETLRFEEEIQSLMHDNLISPPASAVGGGGSSFTALLGLQPSEAVELLHELDPGRSPSFSAAVRFRLDDPKALHLPLGCSPIFPSNAALVERATRFSVFASEDSPDGSSAVPSYSGGDHSPKPKSEPPDSESKPPLEKPQCPAKRKEIEKSSKAQAPAKKNKSAAGEDGGYSPANPDGEKLPYVHVRARRGQATDSHSLAERARREKINARMKLLQELVPGCSKISGTALVLDEIINHVQSLQRQVEFLSMRLAAVNPRIDFTGLDSILSAECGRVTASGHGPSWNHHHDEHHHQQQQQIWHVDLLHPHQHQHQHQHQQAKTPTWESDDTAHLHHAFLSSASGGSSPPGTSLFGYDSAASALSLSNQLKSEL